MQSRGKHVHPAAGLGRQITSGSLIHWSLEQPNWIMGSEVKCACMCVHVQVCLIRQAGPCWVTVLLCPLYLGPSVSIRRDDRHSSFSRDPSPLGHRRPTRVLHYAALPGQCLETSPQEAGEAPGCTEKRTDPISIKIPPHSLFLEVITSLPKSYSRK